MLSKKKRFEVFKRDGFQCVYCGKTPPMVILEVDHILPKSKKGTDDYENLITACFDCNRGKGANLLNVHPVDLEAKNKILNEKKLQYKEYQKLIKSFEVAINNEVETVNCTYTGHFPGLVLSNKFKNTSVKFFIQKIGLISVVDAMHRACFKFSDYCNGETICLKYFCAICWNQIKSKYNE